MNKVIKFSLKYRPNFLQSLGSKGDIATTRLFDDHNLSVGDLVDLEVLETRKRFASGEIVKVEKNAFEKMFANIENKEANYQMYDDYYGRSIQPTDTVKEIIIRLREKTV